jgi:hypothetical protein
MDIPEPFSLYYALAAHDEIALPWSKVDSSSGRVFASNCHGHYVTENCTAESTTCGSCEDLLFSNVFQSFVNRSKWSNSDLVGPKATTHDGFLSHQQMKWKNEAKRAAAKSSGLVVLNANKKITRLAQAQSFHNHVLMLISQNSILRLVAFPAACFV